MPRYDLKKYTGHRFIKPDHVRDEPLRDTIVGVQEGKFGKLELLFESGDILSLNGTNTGTLKDAYGRDSDKLVGKEIEMFLGTIRYAGTDNEAVLVRPITPPQKPDLDDEIPF